MNRTTHHHTWNMLSGCVWAAIAYGIGAEALPRGIIWGGLAVSPLIGLLIGSIYRPAGDTSRLALALTSLFTLLFAAALFGLAVGVFDALRGLPNDAPRDFMEVVYQGVLGVLWGLVMTGYIFVLWPLAYWNHRILGSRGLPA